MSGYTYEYVRAVVNGLYDINNQNYVNEDGRVIPLAQDIETAFPEKKFCVHCFGAACNICFENELTLEEKTTLDGIVATYKAR